MEILGRIVPGIRETRVPLISGYAWLLTLWVAFGDRFDTAPQNSHVVLTLFEDAFAALRGFGLAVAISVAAFMLGSLAGYISDNTGFKPLDERALREAAVRGFAESQLRLQLALPLGLLALVVQLRTGASIALLAFIAPTALTLHGVQLWAQAIALPLRADLSRADLSSANLKGARCNHVNFSSANLQGADLSGAVFNNTNMIGAQLDGANLTGCNLHGTARLTIDQIQSVRSLQRAELRMAVMPALVMVGKDLRDADLSNANLRGADLRRSDFGTVHRPMRAWLIGKALRTPRRLVRLRPRLFRALVELSASERTGASLVFADLSGADLSGASLIGADLKGAVVSGANLEDAHLGTSRLDNVVYDENTHWPSGFVVPESATLVQEPAAASPAP